MNKSAVVHAGSNPLAVQADRLGFEEPSTKEDLIIPRAKLLQALSPEVIEKPKDYQPGLIINSLTKEVLPDVFIPVFKFTNWIKFNPRNTKDPNFNKDFEPGAIIWQTTDPTSPLTKEAEFGENGEKPTAIKFLNFFSYFPESPMPIIASFGKTSFKAGKTLLSLAQFGGGNMFSRKYRLAAKQVTNDIGTFFVFSVSPAGIAEGEDYKAAESLYHQFRAKKVEVHQEDQSNEFANEEN